ncbi:response regulator transcription factor [Pseudomonas sp. dw_358]|uniref:response regulator transcription factor n=1 Tax=Pseudomonas sp. dw_358 TaxID=2720083 RepID=UPI002115F2D0|nr:response regulator transcription factor [Pseudomonas sp. dw_358]
MTADCPAVRILLADDHPIFRMGLRSLIEQDPELLIAGEVGGPLELTEWLHSHPCDLLVTDFMMPVANQADGLRLLEYVQRYWPRLPILVVTSLLNPGLFRAMLNTGVRGLIGKGSLVEELPMAVNQLRRNKLFIARSVTHVLMASGENRINRLFEQEPLSPRELEVTRLFAAGLSVGQIAAAINRSKQTVSAQKVTAMRKLGVPSDAALFIYLQEHHET